MPRAPLTYDAEKHKYYLDGSPIPGVTHVIRQQLSPLHHGASDVMQRAAAFGRAVHSATELWDKNNLDMASCDDALIPYLEAWRKYRRDFPGEIVANEGQICSYKYRYGGTLDRLIDLETPKGRTLTLIDIKTSTVPDAGVGPQTAAYALAAEEYYGLKPKARYCVQLTTEGYRLHPLKDPTDLAAFLAALTCHNWRLKHGK